MTETVPTIVARAVGAQLTFDLNGGPRPAFLAALSALESVTGASACVPEEGKATLHCQATEELRNRLVEGGIERLRSVAEVDLMYSIVYDYLYREAAGFSASVEERGEKVRVALSCPTLDGNEVAELFAPGPSARYFERTFTVVRVGSIPELGKAAELIELADGRAELDGAGGILLPRRYAPAARRLFSKEAAPGAGDEPPHASALPRLPAFPEGLELMPHQARAFRWMWGVAREFGGGLLADDMGLGKTVEAIAWAKSALEGGFAERVLFVCPKSVLRNWESEWAAWAPATQVLTATGSKAERLAALKTTDAAVVIVGYESAANDAAELAAIGFDAVVLDEGHRIRNPETKTNKAMHEIARRSKARFILSGTPFVNRALDLLSEIGWACPGYGPRRKGACEKIDARCSGGDAGAIAALSAWASPVVLRRRKQDVLDGLPSKHERTVRVALEGDQKAVYDEFRERLRLRVSAMDGSEYERQYASLFNALVLLREIADHPRIVDPGYDGGSAKLDAANRMVQRFVGEGCKVVVYTEFLGMLGIVQESLHDLGLQCHSITGDTPQDERQRQAESWRDDDIPVFLVSKAGGEGVNLAAGDTPVAVIQIDPWWNRSVTDQVAGRAWRLGQDADVWDVSILTEGTVDDRVVATRDKKANLGSSLVGGMGPKTKLTKEEFLRLLEPFE